MLELYAGKLARTVLRGLTLPGFRQEAVFQHVEMFYYILNLPLRLAVSYRKV